MHVARTAGVPGSLSGSCLTPVTPDSSTCRCMPKELAAPKRSMRISFSRERLQHRVASTSHVAKTQMPKAHLATPRRFSTSSPFHFHNIFSVLE